MCVYQTRILCVCVRVRKPIQAAQAGKNSLLFFLENVYKHTKINPIRLVLASQMSTKRSCCFLFVFVHKNSLGCSFLFPRTQTATKNTHFLLLFVLFVDSTSRDTSVCVCVFCKFYRVNGTAAITICEYAFSFAYTPINSQPAANKTTKKKV